MLEVIEQLIKEVSQFSAESKEQVEQFRVEMLGKKGKITQLFKEFKNVAVEQKKEFGKQLNILKTTTQQQVDEFKTRLDNVENDGTSTDMSLPGNAEYAGSRHPLSIVLNEIVEIFKRLGFTISTGPEIEDDWHVFSALNFPEEHPARDMQDTFFIGNGSDVLLRTHTSSVQVRAMENKKPPIRIIMPGRVYRNEAVSARSHCFFHQVEGLYIDENVSFADLKQTLLYFAKEFYGHNTKIRLRPSYFPFTEPSAEMDVSCSLCSGKGCNVCKYTGWLEVLGCGMVDPNVLELNGIDNKKYTGFAFGMGIERTAMLRYGVKDIRMFFENDLRFLRQFQEI